MFAQGSLLSILEIYDHKLGITSIKPEFMKNLK